MKRFLLAAVVLSACMSCQKDAVRVEGGLVRGVPTEDESVIVYKSIPYAAAPVGDLRWKAPAPVQKWKGVRVCDSFGPAAIQAPVAEGEFYWHEFYTEGNPEFSEDCLNLCIWAPAVKPQEKLPVAVWYHGGGFQSGWATEKEFDGVEWVRRGVILVSVDYRLGPFGFLYHPLLAQEDPQSVGNYGTLDQIAALKWVKKWIGGFGGDPDNVTIFGQSAGAMSIKDIAASPLARGLFHKAIIQSGGLVNTYGPLNFDANDESESATIGQIAVNSLGATSLEQLRSIEPSAILGTVDAVRAATGRPFVFWPTAVEGVQSKFADALEAGELADVPYMVGGVKGDIMGLGDGLEEFAAKRATQSDKPVYTYKFNRELPGEIQAGAFHSAELWYVFGTLSRSSRPFVQGDFDLCCKMLDHWTSFAKTGDPQNGWKKWSANEDNLMIFDVNE